MIIHSVVASIFCWPCLPVCLPLPTGLRSVAHRNPNVNRALRGWIQSHVAFRSTSHSTPGVVMADFLSEDPGLVDAIIDLNNGLGSE